MGKVMKVFKTLINELFGTKREYKDRNSTRLNSSHSDRSRMPSSA